MTDRLRETDALVTWLRAQGEGALDFYCGKDKKARETSQMVELQIARKQLEAADLIERQGKALRAVEAVAEEAQRHEVQDENTLHDLICNVYDGAAHEVFGPCDRTAMFSALQIIAGKFTAALAERGANDKHE